MTIPYRKGKNSLVSLLENVAQSVANRFLLAYKVGSGLVPQRVGSSSEVTHQAEQPPVATGNPGESLASEVAYSKVITSLQDTVRASLNIS